MGGAFFVKEDEMTMEVSEDLVTALKHVVEWCHGCEGPDDYGIDEMIECDVPVIEHWLVAQGLLPRTVDEEP
jgi:hypothetical protein